MRKKGFSRFILVLAAAALVVQPALSIASEASKLDEATAVLREIMSIPEKEIPPQLFRNAHGIAIILG